jgi:hypothetical protein
MGGDLPDYSRKVIVVYEGSIISGEVKVDHVKIKGLTLKDPTEPLCLPSSIENIVRVNHLQIKGIALKDPYIPLSIPTSVENPALAYDAVNDRFKVDIAALSVGVIPVSLTSIPNPSNLDIVISLLSRETTLTALSAKITNPLPVSLSTLLNPHPITQTNETLLKATVTQADKDRTISSVNATATPLQINLAALNGNSAALLTPAAGKAIRIKFVSLEHSADVDLGYRFGAAGQIEYLRITKGVYVSNLIGCNNQGAADAALYLNSSAATNVKGYIMLVEV